MLPGDDQLVPYGEDSTLSIHRAVETTSTTQASTLYWRSSGSRSQRRHLAGARQAHLETKTTTYTIKNNATVADAAAAESASRTSTPASGAAASSTALLYIDHEADVAHGGYVIRTKERAIKSTSSGAFSRYRFVLAPQEEIVFAVVEDAQHYAKHTRPDAIRQEVLGAERDAAALSASDRSTLERFVERAERRDRLRKVEAQLRGGERVTERTRHDWRAHDALPTSVLESLDGLHALGAKIADGERQKGALRARIDEVFTNQNRLRENIRAFETVGSNKLLQRYLSAMGREEDELIATRAEIAKLDEASARLREQVAAAELGLSASIQRLKEELDQPIEEVVG